MWQLFSLIFLALVVGGEPTVKNQLRRELREVPVGAVSGEAYDGSVTVPLSQQDLEIPVGGTDEKEKSELLKNVQVLKSSPCKNSGPVGNLMFTDKTKITNFAGLDDKGKKLEPSVEEPYFVIFDFGKPVLVDSIVVKPVKKEECPQRLTLENTEKVTKNTEWVPSKVMTITKAMDTRLTWDTDKNGPARFWRLSITSTHASDQKDTTLQYVNFYGRYPPGADNSRPSNFERKMFAKLKDMWKAKNECQANGLFCKCGFKELYWKHRRVTRGNRDCLTLEGICQKCDEANPVSSVGFDYKFEDKGSKDVYSMKTRKYFESWTAPAYKFSCKDGFIITGVKSKYTRYVKLGDRDFYTLKIKCDKMQLRIPSERVPQKFTRRDRRQLMGGFFGNLKKQFQIDVRGREVNAKGGSKKKAKRRGGYGKKKRKKKSKGKKRSVKKKAKRAAKKAKKAIKKAAKKAIKKAKKKAKKIRKLAKKASKKVLKKMKKQIKKAKKAGKKAKKKIAKKVTKKILKKINKKLGKKGSFKKLLKRSKRRRSRRRGGCNKCKRSCSCNRSRCSCRRKCNCSKSRSGGRSGGNQYQHMHVHLGAMPQPAAPASPCGGKAPCPAAAAAPPASPCTGSKCLPCQKGYGDPRNCRKKIGNYVRTLIGEESDVFRLLKVKIQNMHMLNHIMREGMDRHLRKKIVAMHDIHDLIRKKMDPGNKKEKVLTAILEKIDGIKKQRKDYNKKLSKHFANIKNRLSEEHKRLRTRLERHRKGHQKNFAGLSKILQEMQKQQNAKPKKEKADRMERKMDTILKQLADRKKQRAAERAARKRDREEATENKAKEMQQKQQMDYWNKMQKFLKGFKNQNYGKLSQFPSKPKVTHVAHVYQNPQNMPWFLQKALKKNGQLRGMLKKKQLESMQSAESSLESETAESGSESDDEDEVGEIDDEALDQFLEDYGPETEVGSDFWDLDNENLEDAHDYDDELEVGESLEEEEYPVADRDNYFEDELQYFKDEDDENTPDEEYKVGSFDPTDVVDSFLLEQLEGHDEDDFDSEEEEVGEPAYDYSESEDRVGEEFDDEEFDDEELNEYLNDLDDESEDEVGSSSSEYFEMERHADKEEEVGDSSEKPLSVGDSFFDINDDKLADDLAEKFGLNDKKELKGEIDLTASDAGKTEHKKHELMVGVSGLGVERGYWTDSSFTLAVLTLSAILLGVSIYLLYNWSSKTDDQVDELYYELEN